jgi:hypothetical protein
MNLIDGIISTICCGLEQLLMDMGYFSYDKLHVIVNKPSFLKLGNETFEIIAHQRVGKI